MAECLSCRLIQKRDEGASPSWDNIYRSDYWDVVHAYNTSYLGWLVLVARRHFEALDGMTSDEAFDLGALIREVSLALKRHTGCQKTYVMQFAESADHPHVHFHIVPRMPAQAPNDIAYRVMRQLGVPLTERCEESEMNALAQAIRGELELMRQ